MFMKRKTTIKCASPTPAQQPRNVPIKVREGNAPPAKEQAGDRVDPLTNRLIVRNLHFHHFVAHQRESYFQYEC